MFVSKSRLVSKQFLLSFLFLFLCFFFSQINCFAQLPDKTPREIDPAILNEVSPADLQKYLKDKNQVQKKPGEDIHRKRLDKLQKNSRSSEDSTEEDEDDDDKKLTGEEVYGSNLFQNTSILQLAELSTPPLDYPIGVGDHIVVSLWGGADLEIDYVVARDGSIFPEGLGKITVQGLTFDNARAIITDRFRKVTPPSTNISVTMGQPRTIVVNVSGEVNNPGPVVVSAFSNALNVLALAGGLTEFGDLRNIMIRRNGRIIDSLDVYRYLTSGDFGRHL